MISVDIILATYNGDKYIEQQMLSLIGQTFAHWRCIIHDDGSTDRTLEIIKKYCVLDSRFELIEDGICLRNPGSNFIHTLQYSSSDYICFCDQDDIWLESKLETLVQGIQIKDNSIPQAIFCNAYLWNCNTNFIGGKATLAFPKNIESLLFLNCGIQGASSIFNKKMKDILLVPVKNLVMHDWYLTIAACTLGKIDYIHQNLMLYRQHGHNVTGAASGSLKEKTKNFFNNRVALIDKRHYQSLIDFFQVWKSDLEEKDAVTIQKFIESINRGYFSRLLFICSGRWNIYDSKIKLIIKFFVRPYFGGRD